MLAVLTSTGSSKFFPLVLNLLGFVMAWIDLSCRHRTLEIPPHCLIVLAGIFGAPNFFPLCLNVRLLSFAGSSKFLSLVLDLQGLALALCGL